MILKHFMKEMLCKIIKISFHFYLSMLSPDVLCGDFKESLDQRCLGTFILSAVLVGYTTLLSNNNKYSNFNILLDNKIIDRVRSLINLFNSRLHS